MTTKKTQTITDLDASPLVKQAPRLLGGHVLVAMGTVALASGDLDASDIILLTRIPTRAAILSIVLLNDDLGTSLTLDVGLYETGDGAVKDADAYASAYEAGTASTAGVELLNEARDINNMGERVWQDAGDSSDPGGHYDLACTVVTSTTPAAGDLSYRILYTLD